MIRRLSSILLAQSLIVLTTISTQAQSQATLPPVPTPNVTLVPVTSGSYPLGAANHLNVPEDLSKVAPAF